MRTILRIALLLLAATAAAQAPVPAPAPAAPRPPPAAVPPRVLAHEEALRLGLARQPQLRQAQASTEAAKARVEQTRAPLLPQLTGSASWQRSSDSTSELSLGALSSSGTRDLYSLGITGRLLVWDFGQTSGRWRAAQATAAGQADSERGTGDSCGESSRDWWRRGIRRTGREWRRDRGRKWR